MFSRIILFVQTHSDKETGELFYSGDSFDGSGQCTDICDVRVSFFLPSYIAQPFISSSKRLSAKNCPATFLDASILHWCWLHVGQQ